MAISESRAFDPIRSEVKDVKNNAIKTCEAILKEAGFGKKVFNDRIKPILNKILAEHEDQESSAILSEIKDFPQI